MTSSQIAPRASGVAANLPLMLCLGIAATSCAAHMGIIYTPFLVGGLMDRYGFGQFLMGWFASVETLSFAGAMFLFAPRAHAFRPRRMALVASGLIVGAQLASALTGFWPLLLLSRLATGFGYGTLNTAVNVAAGRSSQPERAISLGIALQVILYALLNIAVPRIGLVGGVAAIFVALGMVSGTLALGMFALTDARADSSAQAAQAVPPIAPGGWPVLAAMALFAFGTMAIWPFMERAAHAIHLPDTTYGLYSALSMVLSSLGNFTLSWFLARGGRRGLLEWALMACGTMCAVLTLVDSQIVFGVALQIYNVSWYITYPLLLGLAYAHDPHGRLAVRTTGTWLVAQSAGQVVAGYMAQRTSGYALVGCLGMATCAMAVGLIVWFQAGLRKDAISAVPATGTAR
ncbi:MFS transporter [Novosphingobium acidiphilum]|uniref:MFS transporter n=1 Tax=Novosphingobium acidiphilum TaxID=505248 RepID=UPI000418FCEB|nr:MFS transporter [Novosphingobium acidiphilum]